MVVARSSGRMLTTITKSTDPDLMAVGERTADQIIRISDGEYVYVDEEGERVTELRVQ